MTSNAVNRPTDVKQKEKDVNTKLQLYGIYQAFANGKVPSNKQIDIALNSALESGALQNPSSDISSEGQHLIGDLRNVIEQAKILLLVKNEGNVLQDFIWHTEQLSGGGAAAPGAPVDKQTAQQHATEALGGLRTLGTLLISNGQFRKLLSDATVLLRDIAGDAATSAATRVKPSEEQLGQIDRPADDNTWHDVPTFSKDSVKKQLMNQFSTQKPLSKQDVREAASEATGEATGEANGKANGEVERTAHPTGSSEPGDTARFAIRDRQEGTASGVDAQSGIQTGIQSLQQRANENIPDDRKERAKDYHRRTKDYLSSKMPQERRDRVIWRLKKMVIEVQGHGDYQRAIETLLSLAEIYAGHGRNLRQQGQSSLKGAHEDDHLTAAEADLKVLIERFANSTSVGDLFDAINNIYRDADRDPELKNWFKKLDTHIRRCLQEQGFIMQDSANNQWNDIYDRGQFLLRDRYRDHTNRIIDESRYLINQFAEDPQSKKFGEALQKLFSDLGNDENGKPVFKKHLVKDLTSVIIPAIFENVRYVPVPRIEFSDHTMDAIVENLVIESDNLMPNVLEIRNDNYFKWGRKQISSKHTHSIMSKLVTDVSYYVKKGNFPPITDQGVADILLGGQGFSFKMKLSTVEKGRQCFFKVDKVDVDVKHLNIKLKQSNHKMLFSLFKPLLFRAVRPAIQKALEKQIKDAVHQLDSVVYRIHQEAGKASETVSDGPKNAPNIYSRYYNAAQKQLLRGKEKTDRVSTDKKVNVAVTQQDSVFKSISLPGGISSKATEYKELAAKGDKWESPVFSIGSAQESPDIPRVSPVTRKHHDARRGDSRDANYNASANTGDFGNQVDQAFDSTSKEPGASSSALNGGAYASGEKRGQEYHNAPSGITG
ncbi:hypothetical protein FGG08_006502 [Glutinoglossum americanum]|uniref:Uncharacterized protein n=1 Tax=Glutinoglossum americanum TaxID=1670608 RepID=A0A9P8HW62_9PEZI|nr:hypothetical protein FGG08_006502 [Glutinoglossum americanum]